MTAIPLDVFADIACPWCFIGHRRLAAALGDGPGAAFAPAAPRVRAAAVDAAARAPDARVPGRALRLRARTPPSGWRASPPRRARSGVPYDPAAMRVAPNTRLAHRAVTLARDQGFETQALDALYLAHFAEGLDVTDFAVVVERLADAGLPDPPALAARLAAGEGEEEVAEDETIAAQIGARAVPLVVAGRRIVLQGAQESGVYERFLAHAIDAAPPA